MIDVFTAAGLTPSPPAQSGFAQCFAWSPRWLPRLPKPDTSILSDQFLAEVRGLKHKNVAAELLEKLLKDELGEVRSMNFEGRSA